MLSAFDAAKKYVELGYKVFPLKTGLKRPNRTLTPHGVKDATDDLSLIERWFNFDPEANLGLACNDLIVIDCDPGNNWPGYTRLDQEADCPVQTTPRGGWHFVFRRPEGHDWRNTSSVVAHKIDTRTDGGYIAVDPTHTIDCPEEKTVEGDYAFAAPIMPFEELSFAPNWLVEELDTAFAPKVAPTCSVPIDSGSSDVVRRAVAYLAECPPAISGSKGHDQTFAVAQALVNGFCLDTDTALQLLRDEYNPRCEPPWSEKELRHKVDSALQHPSDKPRGWLKDAAREQSQANDVDISGIEAMSVVPVEPEPDPIIDPGPTPVELLRVPGFIGELMDHCLKTAPYPNPVLAFCGAFIEQAHLGARKVRDPGDNRTNFYLLGLAHSAAGKDWPRKLNMRIAHEIGQSECIGDRMASGEGLQDALFANPAMLFQTDEISGLFQSINRVRDARYENLESQLLTLYSNANSKLPMRAKAGKAGKESGVIDQPCLSILGTAIPKHFYESLSERMLTNGLCGRMVVLEAGKRGKGQEPSIQDLPPRVIEAAHWWTKFQAGEGNLASLHPKPAIVEHTPEARKRLITLREETEEEYARAEDRSDSAATAMWGRATEHVRKLALVYAISENHQTPVIGVESVDWASRLITHLTQRMLAMVAGHVAENPFHAHCLRLLQKLRLAPRNELSRSVLLKRMKVKARDFDEIADTLKESGIIDSNAAKTGGRDACVYRLL